MSDATRAMDDALREAADRFGTPAYVYFWPLVEARVAALDRAFAGRFELSYAVKANPNRALLRKLAGSVASFDVSSAGEVEIALAAGIAPGRLGFSGPAKSEVELRRALEVGVAEVVVESADEMRALAAIARERGARADVLVRVNPRTLPRGFGVGMAGAPSHFGVDEEDLDAVLAELIATDSLRFKGFHVYAGTQCLVVDAVASAYEGFVDVWSAAAARHGLRPERLVFGSGIGIPYDEGQREIDIDALGAKVAPLLDRVKADSALGGARLVLELGRYLVGAAGVFVTRVVRTKTSRGKRFAILDGGLHAHLAAAGLFGSVLRRNYPMHKVGGGGDPIAHELVGPLCTTLDTLATSAMLPEMRAGDLLAIESSGAYGPSASPVHFIARPPPREVLVDAGGLADVTAEGPAAGGGSI